MYDQDCIEESPEVIAKKTRIKQRLASMDKEEVCAIWNAIVECEQTGIEQSEYYSPGIPWTWWVEMVHHFKDL